VLAAGVGAAGRQPCLAFATGEGNGDGQQTGGSQRHTNHGEHPASVWNGRAGAQNCDIMQIFRIMCLGWKYFLFTPV
jgi:hypothetical protein